MSDLEEAWAALGQQLGWSWADGSAILEKRRSSEARYARALALATFWRCYVNHYPCTREELCGPHAERVAIIGRLGR